MAKIQVKIKKKGDHWSVEFNYNHQYFTLEHYTVKWNKTEALWEAKMLRKCFAQYTKDIKK